MNQKQLFSWRPKNDGSQLSGEEFVRRKFRRQALCSGLIMMLCAVLMFQPVPLYAQTGPICYGVTDGNGNSSGIDTLVSLDVVTGGATTIGETGTFNIEAIAFSADGQTLYAANQDVLGTLDLATGAFTAIGPIGGGDGSEGPLDFSDVDGLTFDVISNTLFGTVRRGGAPADLLIKIDPNTGAADPDAFGAGVGYLAIPTVDIGESDLDDIAADPYADVLYAVANSGGAGGQLITIDKATGAIVDLGALGSSDIEGLGFARDGSVSTLYGSTGDNGPVEADNNDLYEIDKTNGGSTLVDGLPETDTLRDYESLDCIYQNGNIGDTIWSDNDNDGNGVVDGDDLVLENVVVNLLDATGAVVATDTTDAAGNYLFEGVDFGTYTVQIDTTTLPPIKQGNPTYDPDGGDDNQSTVTISVDEPNDFDQDFAYFQGLGTIGDTIFHDLNGDGVLNTADGDFPLENVVVTLTDSTGATVGTATTDANGNYIFEDLPLDETYTVTVDTSTLPDSKIEAPTADPDGGADSTSQVTLTADAPEDLDQDFGYEPILGRIGDTIFHDLNSDGVFDEAAGDFPLDGVTVTLNDGTGAEVGTTVTDASGNYFFENLPVGDTYTVIVDTSTLPDSKVEAPTADPDGGADSTSQVALTPEEPEDLDQDFGYEPLLGSIGNQIWHDDDQDGNASPDGDDRPIEGVTVNLLDNTGEVVATQETDSGGFYLFEDLSLGDYVVQVDTTTLPEEKQGNPAYDPDGGDDSTSAVSITADAPDNLDQDFAYFAPETGSIGDTIFHDANGDAILDEADGDFPLENVTVMLLDGAGTEIGTAVTNASGNYLFDELPLDVTYTVMVDSSTLPEDKLTDPTADPDGVLDGTSQVTLTADVPNDLDQDFGYEPVLGSIGDTIWHDDDQDGNELLDGDDRPIENVVVNLLDADGNQVASATTDENGQYLFENLPMGDYTVQIDTATLPVAKQGNPAYDPDGGNDDQSAVTLTPAAPNDLAQDFAYFAPPEPTGSIGDQIWHDDDQDGNNAIDGDDEPIADVTVNLLGSNGEIIATTTTDENGEYLFTEVPFGTYTVQIDTTTLPIAKQGNPAYDPDGGNDDQSVVTIDAAAPNNTDQDFAYFAPEEPTGSIGDQIWHDDDQDGNNMLDGDDRAIANVTVSLLDSNGTPIATTTTDENGEYLFSEVPYGTYTVQVDPATLPASKQGNPAYDPDGGNDDQSVVTIDAAAPNNTDQDFAYFTPALPTGSIGDTIFHDANGDGSFNPADGDFPLPGIQVALVDANGTPIQSVTTDAQGNYLFANLPLGTTYTVVVDTTALPAEKDTAPSADPDGGADSTSQVELTEAAPDNLDQDFGYQPVPGADPVGSIGDTIFHDADSNGAFNPDDGDFALPGVTVTLTDANGVSQTTQTDADGNYLFANLPLGDYTVVVDTTTLPSSKLTDPTADPDGDGDNTSSVSLTPDSPNNIDQDWGYEPGPVSSLGNYVWLDRNANGVQELNEPGIDGVVVALLDADRNVVATTTTDANGFYLFNDLPAGEYAIRVELPAAGFTFSPPDQGDDAFDTDVDPQTGISGNITLGEGQTDLTWDAGIYAPPNLNVEKNATTVEAQTGNVVIYELTYFNSGVGEATGVELSETVPQNTTFVDEGSSDGWSCADGAAAGTTCSYTIGSLAAGARSTEPVFFVVRLDADIDQAITQIDNEVRIIDDGLNGPSPAGQTVDIAVVTINRPTSIGTDFEPGVGGPNAGRTFLPIINQ